MIKDMLKLIIDDDNIEYMMFINNEGKYCVTMVDLDSENTIEKTVCKSEVEAGKKFYKSLPIAEIEALSRPEADEMEQYKNA